MYIYTIILDLLLVLALTIRLFMRDEMLPTTRMAWFMVILVLPFVGGALYFLFGEVDLGHKAEAQHRKIFAIIRKRAARAMGRTEDTDTAALVDPQFNACFRYAASINGFHAVGDNAAELLADDQSARDRLVDDIDAAASSVHIMYYIWLDDKTGARTAEALIRAAARGVTCRVMVDALGSKKFVKSAHWRKMGEAGVQLAVALPINRPVGTLLASRLDLRNHRKITVIDGRIAYCGSQNCADPEFRIKAKYAPWIDIMLRLQGPVVAQMQLLFASDWMKEIDTPIEDFPVDTTRHKGGFTAQIVGLGPTERSRAAPQLFVTLIEAAKRELMITTPYFVPDPTVIEALCAAAYRGIEVSLTLPRNNDSWVVAAASRSFYKKLLEAGVRIYEFSGGLLHAKAMTIDAKALYLGSSNMDMRSFDLNYENDVLIQDCALAGAVRERQLEYIASAGLVSLSDIAAWKPHQRMWHNAIATIGPVL